jgi:hypothetical protein
MIAPPGGAARGGRVPPAVCNALHTQVVDVDATNSYVTRPTRARSTAARFALKLVGRAGVIHGNGLVRPPMMVTVAVSRTAWVGSIATLALRAVASADGGPREVRLHSNAPDSRQRL